MSRSLATSRSSRARGGARKSSMVVDCPKSIHDARMKRGNPRDVSFRALRLACVKLLDDLERVEPSASPAKRARITALRKVVRDLIGMSPCGDSMIRAF